MFKVESNVPVASTRTKWPFRGMQAGESFVIPADEALIQRCRIAAGCYQNGHKHVGMKFSVRKQADGTARCWRTA